MKAIAIKLSELIGMLFLGILFFGMMTMLILTNLAYAYVGWRIMAGLFWWLFGLMS